MAIKMTTEEYNERCRGHWYLGHTEDDELEIWPELPIAESATEDERRAELTRRDPYIWVQGPYETCDDAEAAIDALEAALSA